MLRSTHLIRNLAPQRISVTGEDFRRLHQVVGDHVLLHILTTCALFVPVEKGHRCLQLCGTPMDTQVKPPVRMRVLLGCYLFVICSNLASISAFGVAYGACTFPYLPRWEVWCMGVYRSPTGASRKFNSVGGLWTSTVPAWIGVVLTVKALCKFLTLSSALSRGTRRK